jgi:hypothetical protein
VEARAEAFRQGFPARAPFSREGGGRWKSFQAAIASWEAAQMEPPKPDRDGYGVVPVPENLPKVRIDFDALDPEK